MLKIIRATATHPDFTNLVKELDVDLAKTDGDEHSFYSQFNGLETIKHVVVAYLNATPVACGAIKPFSKNTIEIKRMYTQHNVRGKGIAGQVLKELECWAQTLGYTVAILETGVRQPYAIRLYQKQGYKQTPNYGQYKEAQNSCCFKKLL